SQIPFLLTLVVLPHVLHQVRDLFRLEFVFERWHLFLSVGDHLGDLFIRVLFGVIGLQRRNFNLLVINLHESTFTRFPVTPFAILLVVDVRRSKFIDRLCRRGRGGWRSVIRRRRSFSAGNDH